MRVRVDVPDERATADFGSLLADLRSVPGLSAVLSQTPPEPGQHGPSVESMTVGLTSPSLIPTLISVVLTWLRRHPGSPQATITTDNESRVEIRATDTDREVEQVVSLLRSTRLGLADDQTHTLTATVSGNGRVYLAGGDHHIVDHAGGRAAAGSGAWKSDDADLSDPSSLLVTIYLSDEQAHGQVEAAVADLLETAGLRIDHRDDPVFGSWFRRMRAGVAQASRSQMAREGALIAVHVAHTRLVLAQDATVTATLMQNLGPVITSLQPTKDAVVRLGAVLIVKADWVVTVYQLTAAQQAVLELQPNLATSPHEIVIALNASPAEESGPPALQ